MAMDGTYSGLVVSTADWLNRTDLTVQIPDFVILAEAEMKRRLRRGVVLNQNFPVSAQLMSVPADMAELRSAWFSSGQKARDVPIRIGTLEMMTERFARAAGTAARPTDMAVLGSQFYFSPTPDQTYTANLYYYSKLVPLTSLNPTSALYTEAPDMYLYGTLLQSAPFLENEERVPLWKTKFDAAIDQLNLVRENEEYRASLHAHRLPVIF